MVWAVNSGLPSEESLSGMPYVAKVYPRILMSPVAPSLALSPMGQFEYRGVIAAMVMEIDCTYAMEGVF